MHVQGQTLDIFDSIETESQLDNLYMFSMQFLVYFSIDNVR